LRKDKRIVSLEEYTEVREMEAPERKDYSELYEAVQHLPEGLRLTVTLYYMEGFSVKEVASIMDVSEGAVQKRLVRAREQMKKELQNLEVEFI
jgi:RNA polymerase sigma-70 factor (ECF subfamily)